MKTKNTNESIKTSLLNKIKQLNSGGRLDLSIDEVKVLQDDEKLIEEVIEMNLLFGAFSTDIIKIENNSGELFDFIEERGSMVGFPVIYMENEIIILESAYGHGKEDKVYTSKAFAFIN